MNTEPWEDFFFCMIMHETQNRWSELEVFGNLGGQRQNYESSSKSFVVRHYISKPQVFHSLCYWLSIIDWIIWRVSCNGAEILFVYTIESNKTIRLSLLCFLRTVLELQRTFFHLKPPFCESCRCLEVTFCLVCVPTHHSQQMPVELFRVFQKEKKKKKSIQFSSK